MKKLIFAMALDLKRASLGSDLFLHEFLKNKNKSNNFPAEIRSVIDSVNLNTDKEDLLMYSTILQNYAGRK